MNTLSVDVVPDCVRADQCWVSLHTGPARAEGEEYPICPLTGRSSCAGADSSKCPAC